MEEKEQLTPQTENTAAEVAQSTSETAAPAVEATQVAEVSAEKAAPAEKATPAAEAPKA
ncbi:MAG: 30S ribosomal protein S16, partial [Alloprevotella sp.]